LLSGSAFWLEAGSPLAFFGSLLAASLFLMSLMMVNFNTLAMEPVGAIAGTASSVIGLYTTMTGTVLGLLIGQAFDGTVIPLSAGFMSLGIIGLLIVLWTERGQLF